MRGLHNGTTTVALLLAMLGFATAAQAEPTLYSASLIVHSFANDATGALYALPIGANCNPANGGTTCFTETLRKGAPLTGTGIPILSGSAPFSFSFAQGLLGRKISGSFPTYSGISYTLTTADLQNAAGIFGPGKGPGSFSYVPALGAGLTRVAAVAGKNRFGGVMQLIGSFGTRIGGSTSGGGMWRGIYPSWGFTVVGASYAKTAKISGSIMSTYSSSTYTYIGTAVVTGFPWTTGQVSVEAPAGFSTALVRTGYDNRTAQGLGTIQMVAPHLTHWAGGAHWGDVAILNVKFVPEPKGWLMLVAGLGLLGAMHRGRPKAR